MKDRKPPFNTRLTSKVQVSAEDQIRRISFVASATSWQLTRRLPLYSGPNARAPEITMAGFISQSTLSAVPQALQRQRTRNALEHRRQARFPIPVYQEVP